MRLPDVSPLVADLGDSAPDQAFPLFRPPDLPTRVPNLGDVATKPSFPRHEALPRSARSWGRASVRAPLPRLGPKRELCRAIRVRPPRLVQDVEDLRGEPID